ncbi:lysozyme c-1-like [Ruditapes philippinarum]|uniref:lysozyme c-1-like n=1 Tax=Ruditapes philippinarum TaxID=129788 RepID=UPI00295B936D|nr:lysozyme c-1-like [Ruditapes philippinarum]
MPYYFRLYLALKMDAFRIVALLTIAFIDCSLGATKSKCDVVNALKAEGVPDADMRDWLCLVQHESNYEYNVTKYKMAGSAIGSVTLGIFQFNNAYWCGNANGTSSPTCWKLRTFGCADACNTFLDPDISNDANCAVRVKNCDGFHTWVGWAQNCVNDTTAPSYDYSGC